MIIEQNEETEQNCSFLGCLEDGSPLTSLKIIGHIHLFVGTLD